MTESSSTGQAVGMEDVPDPQVPERPKRRTYTAKYKRDILTEYDRLGRQERGALLRREKLSPPWSVHGVTSAIRAF